MTNLLFVGTVLGSECSLCVGYCNIVILGVNLVVDSKFMDSLRHVTCHVTSWPILIALLSVRFPSPLK